jgi:hypothetical protein
MDNNGWIKIHRKLLEWEWADDPNMVALWIHLLLNANLTDKKYRGKTIPRGSFKTSLNELAEETGLSKRKLRTCLERLKSTHEVTQQTTHDFSIITICKFDDYQLENYPTDTPNDTPNDTQATHQRHTEQRKSPTPPKESIEEGKNERNIFKKEKSEKEKSDWDVLFDEWLEYKKQRKETYHSQLALDRMKTKLRNLSGNNIETARAIINEAMANNWAGFFALRNDPKKEPDHYKGDDTIGKNFVRRGFKD